MVKQAVGQFHKTLKGRYSLRKAIIRRVIEINVLTGKQNKNQYIELSREMPNYVCASAVRPYKSKQ